MSASAEEKDLQLKLRSLQQRLEHLRLGRRILMNLLEATQEESKIQLRQLQEENEKLRRQNSRLAKKLLMEKAVKFRSTNQT